MAKKRILLDYSYEFSILGLRTPLKNFKLAWNLNKKLKINLSKIEDLCITDKNKGESRFIQFNYSTENSAIRLIKNKNIENEVDNTLFLLPGFHHLDYVIQLSGEFYPLELTDIIRIVKEIKEVELVSLIDLDDLNNRTKENLII